MTREELLQLRREADEAIEKAKHAADLAGVAVSRFDRAREAQPVPKLHVDVWKDGGCVVCGALERGRGDYAHEDCRELLSRPACNEILALCFARDLYDARFSDLAIANLRRMTAREAESLPPLERQLLTLMQGSIETIVRENTAALVKYLAEKKTSQDIFALTAALERDDYREVSKLMREHLAEMKGLTSVAQQAAN